METYGEVFAIEDVEGLPIEEIIEFTNLGRELSTIEQRLETMRKLKNLGYLSSSDSRLFEDDRFIKLYEESDENLMRSIERLGLNPSIMTRYEAVLVLLANEEDAKFWKNVGKIGSLELLVEILRVIRDTNVITTIIMGIIDSENQNKFSKYVKIVKSYNIVLDTHQLSDINVYLQYFPNTYFRHLKMKNTVRKELGIIANPYSIECDVWNCPQWF